MELHKWFSMNLLDLYIPIALIRFRKICNLTNAHLILIKFRTYDQILIIYEQFSYSFLENQYSGQISYNQLSET